MKKFTEAISAIHEAEAAGLSELQKSYQDYFKAKLNKFGAKSPADLSPEDKSAFFSEISKDWERGQGAKPAGKKDMEEHGVKESVEVNEAEIKSDGEFKEYAKTVLKKAFADKYDEDKAMKTAEGILKKADGDYGAAVGMLTSSLGESETCPMCKKENCECYKTDEGNAFGAAVKKAKEEGKDEFEVDGKKYKVEEYATNEGKMTGSGRMASYQMDNMNNGLRNDSVFITTDRFGSKNTLSIKISAYSGGADEIEMAMPKKLAELNTAVRTAMGSKDAEAMKAGEDADMQKSKMLQDMQAEIFDAVAKELAALDGKIGTIVSGIVKKY